MCGGKNLNFPHCDGCSSNLRWIIKKLSYFFLQLAGTAKALAEGGTDEEKTKLVSKQASTESDVWN